jgi:peptidyl-tRNA hydrolase
VPAANVYERERGGGRGVARFYQLAAPRVLIVVDDADLPLGQIRLRPEGSSGGHHGLESIERAVGHAGIRACDWA